MSVLYFHEKYKRAFETDIRKLINDYNRENKTEELLFLNFNYTNSIRKLVNHTLHEYKTRLINIYGSVDGNENPIIFGYGDDTGDEYLNLEISNEPELLWLIKSFQYPKTYNYHNLLGFHRLCQFDVIVISYSYGLLDRTLLKSIFEHKLLSYPDLSLSRRKGAFFVTVLKFRDTSKIKF